MFRYKQLSILGAQGGLCETHPPPYTPFAFQRLVGSSYVIRSCKRIGAYDLEERNKDGDIRRDRTGNRRNRRETLVAVSSENSEKKSKLLFQKIYG